MMRFRGTIFDIDGTLVDSMHIWTKIDDDFLSKRGIATPADYASTIAAMSFPEVARYTIERFSLDQTEDEIMAEWMSMARHEYEENIKLKAGAATYLNALKEQDVRLAIATSLSRELAYAVLRSNSVLDLFDVFCHTDEAARGKETPEIFLLAADRLGCRPDECIVFEDILPAIRSARSAGMRVCAVFDPFSEKERDEIIRSSDLQIEDFISAPLP